MHSISVKIFMLRLQLLAGLYRLLFSNGIYDYIQRKDLDKYKKEASSPEILSILTNKSKEYKKLVLNKDKKINFYFVGGLDESTSQTLYALVRSKRPSILVETGVCNGVSSLYMLSALDKNKYGHLYSIDYPFYPPDEYSMLELGSFIPKGKKPGWIIPSSLRSKWTLIIGKSEEKLPSLLEKLDKVDIFIHDSDHTYNNMTFEYNTAWKHLKKNGYLISHDIPWNSAFIKFARKKRRKIIGINGITGMIVK